MVAKPATVEREAAPGPGPAPMPAPEPAAELPRDLEALGAREFDVAVIGGGMHGAWIAWRAAEAGYRTALVERGEFGAATSANSLKILHGGLRYLQHLNLRRMRASIRARREFARLAPELVQPLPCVMPLKGLGLKSPWVMAPALMANDLLTSDRNAGVLASAQLPHGGLIRGRKCRDLVAPLVNLNPAAGAMWWDAIALDTAALTLAPLRAAVEAGAVVVSGIEARGLRVHGRAVRSVVVRDELVEGATTGVLGVRGDVDLNAQVVVDATGPWAGRLAARAGLSPSAYLPKGWVGALNLVLNRSLGLEAAVALPSVSRPAAASAVARRKSREFFFVPWNGVTMIGTDYYALEPTVGGFAPEDSAPPADAVERFIAEINRVAPRARVRLDDVAHVHWGVLPGEAPESVVPRKTAVVAGGRRMTGAAGLVVAIGEKLTSAPVVAERVLRCIKVATAEAQRARRKGRRRSRGGGSGGSGGSGGYTSR